MGAAGGACAAYLGWTTTTAYHVALSTLRPLASVSTAADGRPFYTLLHPSRVTERGGLEFFAVPPGPGEELVCMASSKEELAGLSAGVAAGRGDVQGALAIYCGGCALHVGDGLDAVGANLATLFDGRPVMGMCTYGEQGVTAPSGVASHGKLMYSKDAALRQHAGE